MKVRVTPDYLAWLNGLRDCMARARIQARVDRLVHGNPGAHRVLKAGVCELKLDFGPGFRVYYLRRGEDWLILLAGGDKSTQAADIRRALQLAADFTGGTS